MNRSFDIISKPVVDRENYELQQHLLRYIMSLASAVIILGNGLVIMAVIRKRQMRRVHCHLYIVSLSVADLLTGISSLCILILRLQDRNPLMSCLIGRAIGVGFITCSLHHLTLISMDRLISIQYPFEYRRFCTRVWKAVFIIFAVWGIAMAECGLSVALLYAEFNGKPPGLAGESSTDYCRFDVVTKQVKLILATTVFQVSVVCICYLKMYAIIRKRLATIAPLSIPERQTPMPSTVSLHPTVENKSVIGSRPGTSHTCAMKNQLPLSIIKPSEKAATSDIPNAGDDRTNNKELVDKIYHSLESPQLLQIQRKQLLQRQRKTSPHEPQRQTPASHPRSRDTSPDAAKSLNLPELLFALPSQETVQEKHQRQQSEDTSCKDPTDIGKTGRIINTYHDALADCYAATSSRHSTRTRRNGMSTIIQHNTSCEQQVYENFKVTVKQCVTTASNSSAFHYYKQANTDNSATEPEQRNKCHLDKQVRFKNESVDKQQASKPRDRCNRDIMEDHFSGGTSGQRTAYHQHTRSRKNISESISRNNRRIHQDNLLRQNWKIAIAGLKTVIPFIVCIAPTVIYWVIELIYGYMILPSYYLSICHCLALTIGIVNPIIYSRALPGIKESYSDAWRKLKRQCSRP